MAGSAFIPGGTAVGNRSRLAPLLAAALGVTMLAGCKVVLSAPDPSPAPPSATGRAAAPSAPASGGHRKLARIADEGRVTYSITLTRCRARAGGQLPDPRCTPGSVDPAVTQATIDSTICRSGYTEGVRPPESQTTHAKYDVVYPAYHVPDRDSGELDHLVSLELGGSNDITNLWPEVGPLPNPKDKVENALHRAVCDGRVRLAAAQRAIAINWRTAEARLGLG
jgi:hypothetical protein